MDEKRKTYPSHTITIESEEYRDLIIENEQNKHEASEYRSKYWDATNKTKAVEDNLKKLQSDYDNFTAFLSSSSEAAALFKAYMAEKALKASGGAVSVF